jgi:hypothetical protein
MRIRIRIRIRDTDLLFIERKKCKEQSRINKRSHLHRDPAAVSVSWYGWEDDKLEGVQLDGVQRGVGLDPAAVQLRLDVLHIGVVLLNLKKM